MRNERKLVNALLVGAVALGACSPERKEIAPAPSPTEPIAKEVVPNPLEHQEVLTEEPDEYIPQEAVSFLLGLGEGYELGKEGEYFVARRAGELFARLPEAGLTASFLENGRKVYTGLEVNQDSELAKKLPEDSEFVLDNLGHLSVLSEGRVIGVYYESELLVMPGLDRWGANELQVIFNDWYPRVVSSRGTELYRYMDGEWRSALQPGLSTYFIRNGKVVTTGHFLVEGTPTQARSNVGEFDKNAQAVVLFDNPKPYIYDAPWNDVYDEVVIEGVILTPDGRPSLVRIPIAPAGSTDDIRVLRRSNITGGPQALRRVTKDELHEMSIDEYVELISRKVYGYVFMELGLIEGKVHPDYINHPLYEWYRNLESAGGLDFLEDTNKQSPYIVPLRVMSLVLDDLDK